MFATTPVVTIRGSVRAFGLKLWDEERACLVPFPPRRACSASRTLEDQPVLAG